MCWEHFGEDGPALLYDFTSPNWVQIPKNARHEAAKQRYERCKRRTPQSCHTHNTNTECTANCETSQAPEDTRLLSLQTELQQGAQDVPDSQDNENTCYDAQQEASLRALHSQMVVQTDMTALYVKQLESELQNRSAEVYHLHEQLKMKSLDRSSLLGDDDKVLVYTGLTSFDTLDALVDFISPYLCKSHMLTCFERVVMAIIRLRLNTVQFHLSYQFGVFQSTVGRDFHTCIDCMHSLLETFVK